jgi:hypothetical protein
MLRVKEGVYNESDGQQWIVELVNEDGTAWCHEIGGARRIIVRYSGHGPNNEKWVRECSAS